MRQTKVKVRSRQRWQQKGIPRTRGTTSCVRHWCETDDGQVGTEDSVHDFLCSIATRSERADGQPYEKNHTRMYHR